MGWSDLRGTATLWLAAASVLFMVAVALAPELHDEWVLRAGFIPLRFDIRLETTFALLPAWITPLSASFLHADWWHLMFNMVLLLFCGLFVERAEGWGALIVLYVVGAYAAAVAQYLVDPVSIVPMIGSSGAISAIFGVFSLIYGKPKPVTRNPAIDRGVHAAWLLAFWILIQWMVSVIDGGMGYSIATAAHVGGFVAGMALYPLLRQSREKTQ